MNNKMNKELMKSQLIRDKEFLKSLYEGSNPLKNRRVLNSANDLQLDTVLKYLHFVSNGHIKKKKENFENISKEKKLKTIKENVETKKKISTLLKSDRSAKLKFLNKLCKVYSSLFYILFNEN
jgi:hypothetical protein